MNDFASMGNFVWSDGEPVIYENWNPGEPQVRNQSQSQDRCLYTIILLQMCAMVNNSETASCTKLHRVSARERWLSCCSVAATAGPMLPMFDLGCTCVASQRGLWSR